MLRALFVIAIIAYGCAKSVKGPFYALLFYLWIAYFRPEAWLWSDFFSQLKLSLIMGTVVLLATLLSGVEKFRFGVGPTLIILFVAQNLVSTVLSPNAAYAWIYYEDFIKVGVICVLIVALVNDERRLRLTLVIIALSLGFEGVKQGWAQLVLNPGAQNMNDYPVLGDNNGVAVGMLMLTSIVTALARTSPTKWQRHLARFAAVGTVYRAVSTYSRGGFLSCGALAMHYLARSQRKVLGALAIVTVCALIIPVLPDAFWDRMNTIGDAREDVEEADSSIRGRLHFWQVGLLMAFDRPLVGVGHNAYNASYTKYDFSGEWAGDRSVHSSWFGVLSESGFPGFFLFVLLIGRAMWSTARTQRQAKKHPELANLGKFANGLEGALITFCVGGAFVIFQYHELLWHTLALTMAVERITRDRLAAIEGRAVPSAAAVVGSSWVPPGRLALPRPGGPGAGGGGGGGPPARAPPRAAVRGAGRPAV